MKKTFIALFLASMLFSSCSGASFEQDKNINSKDVVTQTSVDLNNIDADNVDTSTLLVKREDKQTVFTQEMVDLGVESIVPVGKETAWFTLNLKEDVSSLDIFNDIRKLNCFNNIDLNYYSEIDTVGLPTNATINSQRNLDSNVSNCHKIEKLWEHMDENSPLNDNGEPITQAGGSSDVIVAVVDTGVDYTHPDLVANMWVNVNEIPNNGIDDDLNGYVDDYRGYNSVANTDDVMDNYGHGTHVAGIVGMANNNIGGIGIAYNCKIMAVKISSEGARLGTSAQVAAGIEYAYLNGADIINMSWGGEDESQIIRDICKTAYENALLVASAGNKKDPNEDNGYYMGDDIKPNYPGAYPFVVGVMASEVYSNFDTIKYSNVEYETKAHGEYIKSTYPGGKYASMSGTSMAAPVVSGIAALIRSMYPDKAAYTNKNLFSQLVNTGEYQSYVNAYDAATKLPTPKLCYSSFYTFDNPDIDPANNGDGIIDAGELIQVGVTFKNIGGLATNIKASINGLMGDGENPYIEIVKGEIDLDKIGTYSTREPRFIKDDNGYTVGIEDEDSFLVRIKENVPNNITTHINLYAEYNNGLDTSDNKTYFIDGEQLNVLGYAELSITLCNAVTLPSVISEDTTFKGDKLYVLTQKLTIMPDVTVVFEGGSTIMFGLENQVVLEEIEIINYGTLNFLGEKDNRIKLISNQYKNSLGTIYTYSNISANEFTYCDIYDFFINATSFDNCHIEVYQINATTITNSYIDCVNLNVCNLIGNTIYTMGDRRNYRIQSLHVENNLFINNTDKEGGIYTPYYSATLYLGIHQTNYDGSETYVPPKFNNNVIMNVGANINDPVTCMNISTFYLHEPTEKYCILSNNTFIGIYNQYLDYIVEDYLDGVNDVIITFENNGESDYSLLPPIIKDVQIYDESNNLTDSVSGGLYTVDVIFSRDMDTTIALKVNYGSTAPYIEARINGEWVSATTWRGTFENKDITAGGLQRFNISNAKTADGTYDLKDKGVNFTFNINSSHTQSLNLFAEATDEGILISWLQDDYDTLLGYNVYRSESKDGNYVKLNTTTIPENENTFLDVDAVPGVTYWYVFTVTLTDFTESAPSGKISCQAIDNIAPNIYHTPVSQAYVGNNLTINCTASDNVSVVSGLLYYRTKGQTEYNSITMNIVNDKLSGTIPGSALSTDGLEYFIVVSDGANNTYKGDANNPYSVVVKEAETLSYMGDVNGDGLITSKDALMIIQFIEEKIILTDDQFKRADLNGDGVLSSVEALRILQYVNGKIDTLEM